MSWLEDDGLPSGEFIAVEKADVDEPAQALWVRVGPVFHGNEEDREPGIWITYQEKYMGSSLAGPVLLTPRTWKQLNRAIRWRLRYRRRRYWLGKLGL